MSLAFSEDLLCGSHFGDVVFGLLQQLAELFGPGLVFVLSYKVHADVAHLLGVRKVLQRRAEARKGLLVPSSTLLSEYYDKLQQTTLETTKKYDVFLVTRGQILGALMQNPELWRANSQFLSFIKKEYRMNEMVVGIAKRAILLAQNPHLAQIEHDLMHAAQNPAVLPEHVKEIVQRLK